MAHHAATSAADHAALVDDVVRRVLALADVERAVRDHAMQIRGDLMGVPELTLIAVGKAAAGMVRSGVAIFGNRVRDGVVIVPTDARGAAADSGPLPEGVELIRADHPTPSALSVAAGERVEALVTRANEIPGRVVVLLLSGGASALMAAPRPGVTLDDIVKIADALMRAGAGIDELNTVRRRLDRLKGGGLLRLAARTQVFTYAVSDVPSGDVRAIGSGPGTMDMTSDADALKVLAARGALEVSPAVTRLLSSGVERVEGEPCGVPRLRVVRDNAGVVKMLGPALKDLGDVVETRTRVQGEAREVARAMVERLREAAAKAPAKFKRPRIVVWGGETTVTVRGGGVGGRNQEFALAAALEAAKAEANTGAGSKSDHAILVASVGTDGIDGNTRAAGAFVTGGTAARARSLGLDIDASLGANDSNSLFTKLEGAGERCLITTGPTGTNVNDLMLGVIWPM